MILDTDILSAIVSPRCPGALSSRLEAHNGPLYTTAVNWGEICFGLARHPSGRRLRNRYQELILPALEILPFDSPSAEVYGALRALLEKQGRPLAEADLMIAAIALNYSLPLASANTRHFSRIPGLSLHNWLTDAS